MKVRKTILATVFLLGAIGPNVASAGDGEIVVSRDTFTAGSYCHIKYPAIRESTLGTAHPTLKEASSGDLIDFYGACDHDPLGKDEIQAQKLQLQHRRGRE
jgi:hypothetical protein